MDLQQLSQSQLEKVLNIADILSMQDLSVAASVLASYDWNIQKAIGQVLQSPIQQNQSIKSSQSYSESEEQPPEKVLEQKKRKFEQDHTSLLTLQATKSQTKDIDVLNFRRTYSRNSRIDRQQYLISLMNRSQFVCKNILSKQGSNMKKYDQNRVKVQNNRSFINYLYKNYNPKINFTFGTFFLNLVKSYLLGKFLLVYIHRVDPESETKYHKLIELLLGQQQTAKFVNQNCVSYGMFDNSDDYEIIQKYIALKQLPAFALFKFNKNNKSQQFISTYNILNQSNNFMQWLAQNIVKNAIKTQKIQHNLTSDQKDTTENKKNKQQSKAANQYKEQLYADYSLIRSKQDELYFQLQNRYMLQRQVSADKKQQLKTLKQQLQIRQKQALQDIQPQSDQNCIEIRFRMPTTGKSKTRRFKLNDKIQKLFAYVDCFCRDQFQEKFNDFDLRQTFPSLSLRNLQEKTLSQVFEGSNRQNIIIRQL